MQDDNLYPRSSAFRPTEPANQKAEKQKEEAQVSRALPILQDILDRFEERVEFYGSIDSVPDEVMALPDEFMHVVAANKLAKQILSAELEYLKELIKTQE